MNRDRLRKATDILIQDLPEDASWDDLMYRIYVRQKIDNGEKDKESGDVFTTAQVEEHFDQK